LRDAEFHLDFLEAALEELENYLLSQEVFWPVGTKRGLPSLTLGGLDLSRTALVAVKGELDPDSRRRSEELEKQIETSRGKWGVAWERKAAAELTVRLNQWRAYLSDLEERPGEAQHYSQEARTRAMASYLVEAAGQAAEVRGLVATLAGLDARLRKSFRAGPFIWEQPLEALYPPEPYWFLYGLP